MKSREACKLCGQTLPAGIRASQLEIKFNGMLAKREQRLRDQYLAKQRTFERRVREQESDKWERKVSMARRVKSSEIKKAEERGSLNGARVVRAKEFAEKERLLRRIDELSLSLAKQSSEDRGELAEGNFFSELRARFPNDRIERVPRGVSGCDVLQHIKDTGIKVPPIVYECKDVKSWQNGFIEKAQGYKRQYETPHVIIVSTAMPRNKKGLCSSKGILIVQPRMALELASIIRESAVEMARVGGSGADSSGKSRQLFEYIRSDAFIIPFREMGDGLSTLSDLQGKEMEWHSRNWKRGRNIRDRVESCRRDLDKNIKEILRGAMPAASRGVLANSSPRRPLQTRSHERVAVAH